MSNLRGTPALVSETDPRLDRIRRLAASLFQTPCATVTLFDQRGMPEGPAPKGFASAPISTPEGQILGVLTISADNRRGSPTEI